MDKYGTAEEAADENIIRRMRFACWITKARDTLRISNAYWFTAVALLTQTHLSVAFYIHCVSCNFFIFTELSI